MQGRACRCPRALDAGKHSAAGLGDGDRLTSTLHSRQGHLAESTWRGRRGAQGDVERRRARRGRAGRALFPQQHLREVQWWIVTKAEAEVVAACRETLSIDNRERTRVVAFCSGGAWRFNSNQALQRLRARPPPRLYGSAHRAQSQGERLPSN